MFAGNSTVAKTLSISSSDFSRYCLPMLPDAFITGGQSERFSIIIKTAVPESQPILHQKLHLQIRPVPEQTPKIPDRQLLPAPRRNNDEESSATVSHLKNGRIHSTHVHNDQNDFLFQFSRRHNAGCLPLFSFRARRIPLHRLPDAHYSVAAPMLQRLFPEGYVVSVKCV